MHSSFLLIGELLRRNWPILLAIHGSGYVLDLARERGFPHVLLPALGPRPETARRDGFRAGNLLAVSRCRDTIRRHCVALVHANDKRMLRTWSLPVRWAGIPMLAHWRSVYSRSWSVDLSLRLSAKIVCVSAYSKDLLPPWAQVKSDVVYNPFRSSLTAEDVAAARRRVRVAANLPAGAAVVGFFGNLIERKRPHVLLQILQRLKHTSDGRPVYGVFCGANTEPRDQTYSRMLEEGDWQGRIIINGYVSNVAEWMAACDVLVVPAVREPLARVGVEAQCIGLPAIVSSDGGLVEVVQDGVSGLIVAPDDFEGWVSGVRRVLEDGELARRLAQGGLAAASNLTLERHADNIEVIYDALRARCHGD